MGRSRLGWQTGSERQGSRSDEDTASERRSGSALPGGNQGISANSHQKDEPNARWAPVSSTGKRPKAGKQHDHKQRAAYDGH